MARKFDSGIPYPREIGPAQNVVVAAFALSSMNQLAAQVKLPEGSVMSLVDRNGTLLVRYPNPEDWVGRRLPQNIFNEMKRAQGKGYTRE